MKKINRVTDNKDFSKIIKTGRFLKSDLVKVYFLKNNLDHSRVGISVSKKIGNAVVRSTTRRRIRAVIDEVLDFKAYKLDFIIIAKEKILKATHLELVENIKNIVESIEK